MLLFVCLVHVQTAILDTMASQKGACCDESLGRHTKNVHQGGCTLHHQAKAPGSPFRGIEIVTIIISIPLVELEIE